MNPGQMLTNIRIRCGTPRPQQPGDRTVLLLLSTSVQNFLTELNLTGRPWAVDETSLVVVVGQEDYVLSVGDSFGKPLQVRSVYPTNPGHIEQDIDFFDLGDLNFDWPFPKNFGAGGSWDGSPNNMSRIAFFRRTGQNQAYARVIPIPQQSATYQILFQVGEYGTNQALEEALVLPEHHSLIELRTALALLPHCRWSDDTNADDKLRDQLAKSMLYTIRPLEKNFKAYVATMTGYRGMTIRHYPTGD